MLYFISHLQNTKSSYRENVLPEKERGVERTTTERMGVTNTGVFFLSSPQGIRVPVLIDKFNRNTEETHRLNPTNIHTDILDWSNFIKMNFVSDLTLGFKLRS